MRTGATITVNAEAVAGYHDRTAGNRNRRTQPRAAWPRPSRLEFVVFRGGDGQRDQVAIIVGKPEKDGRCRSGCIRPA